MLFSHSPISSQLSVLQSNQRVKFHVNLIMPGPKLTHKARIETRLTIDCFLFTNRQRVDSYPDKIIVPLKPDYKKIEFEKEILEINSLLTNRNQPVTR